MIVFGSVPIGNMKDATFNLIENIKLADLVVVENIEPFQKILDYYNIEYNNEIINININSFNNVFVIDDRNAIRDRVSEYCIKIISLDKMDKKVLILSDEGSSVVTDIGLSIKNVLDAYKIRYKVLPGPSAIISSLSISNLYNDEMFSFYGMIHLRNNRVELYDEIKKSSKPSVIFTIPETLYELMLELESILGKDRKATLVSNATTDLEFIMESSVSQIKDYVKDNWVKKATLIISSV